MGIYNAGTGGSNGFEIEREFSKELLNSFVAQREGERDLFEEGSFGWRSFNKDILAAKDRLLFLEKSAAVSAAQIAANADAALTRSPEVE